MHIAPLPHNEADRLKELARHRIMDTAVEAAFDDVTTLAAQICEVPIALITLIDADRQWFKAQIGLAIPQTHRDLSFCAHAILTPDMVTVVPDIRADTRFANHPFVSGDPGLRFYAGAPILSAGGLALGTVCVLDRIPRHMRSTQIESLRLLARQTAHLIEQHLQNLQAIETAHQAPAAPSGSDELLALQAEGLELTALIDPGYVYRYVSPLFLDHCGQAREQIEGHHVADLIGQDAFEAQVRPLLDQALAGTPVSYDARFEFSRRSGPQPMQVDYLPVRNSAAQVCGVLVRIQDVQTLRDSRNRLQAALEAIGAAAAQPLR
ncbi:MAG: hypothetical protein RJA44_1139 [Pseudomonadota bacterium]